MSALIAKVYVDMKVYHIDMAFDYLVPLTLKDTLCVGCRVIVPFGKGNKRLQGLVSELVSSDKVSSRLKQIIVQLDPSPIITDEMLSMVNFLVRNTFCTHYEAIKTVLPIGTNITTLQTIGLATQPTISELEGFNNKERCLVEFLKTDRSKKELVTFFNRSGKNPFNSSEVVSLLNQGIVQITDNFKPLVSKNTVKMVRLADGVVPNELDLTPKQKELTLMLENLQVAVVKELCYFCGVTEIIVKNLVNKRVVEYFEVELEATAPAPSDLSSELSQIVLSNSQSAAFEGILALQSDENPHVALLHGITGSGKTQVYIKLIEQVLLANKTAMMLVPEISLTPQMVRKFKELFGTVAVIHSSLSARERLNEFNRIKKKLVNIVIGTRSAIFAPLENIGIIIMDEEGEASYKSDQSPRYHTREVAKQRCVTHNCTLVLGSATPSIDSFYRAETGAYKLFTIEERFQNAALPNVYIVDMLDEQTHHNFSSLSEILQQQIRMNIEQHEQSILFINRRGYNTYATCMQCGEVVHCKSCDVAMTYHKANGYLMCHYCGHTVKWDSICPACKGKYIKLTGIGTQKLEDEISLLFPTAKVLRMDTDTTYSRHAYEKNFDDFRNGKYDIMLGTQMIAKGLDFPNVTLVGVMNADSGLYSSDFKSSERIFSIITQVVGRSGRSEKTGRAYIQTQNVQNDIINFAANQDYNAFYHDEIKTRKLLTYPPFCDICVLGFSGADDKQTQTAAIRALSILKELSCEQVALKVLGVTPAMVHKVSDKFRYRIIIKCKFNNKFKLFLSSVLKECAKDKLFVKTSIFADINGNINI